MFLAGDQKYLCLKKFGRLRKGLSSQLTSEFHLVAQPVGDYKPIKNGRKTNEKPDPPALPPFLFPTGAENGCGYGGGKRSSLRTSLR